MLLHSGDDTGAMGETVTVLEGVDDLLLASEVLLLDHADERLACALVLWSLPEMGRRSLTSLLDALAGFLVSIAADVDTNQDPSRLVLLAEEILRESRPSAGQYWLLERLRSLHVEWGGSSRAFPVTAEVAEGSLAEACADLVDLAHMLVGRYLSILSERLPGAKVDLASVLDRWVEVSRDGVEQDPGAPIPLQGLGREVLVLWGLAPGVAEHFVDTLPEAGPRSRALLSRDLIDLRSNLSRYLVVGLEQAAPEDAVDTEVARCVRSELSPNASYAYQQSLGARDSSTATCVLHLRACAALLSRIALHTGSVPTSLLLSPQQPLVDLDRVSVIAILEDAAAVDLLVIESSRSRGRTLRRMLVDLGVWLLAERVAAEGPASDLVLAGRMLDWSLARFPSTPWAALTLVSEAGLLFEEAGGDTAPLIAYVSALTPPGGGVRRWFGDLVDAIMLLLSEVSRLRGIPTTTLLEAWVRSEA